MNWTKLYALARATMAAALSAVVGMAAVAGAALIVAPTLPGHVVTSWWDSAQPRIQAFVTVVPKCKREARHYRRDPDYLPLERCLNSRYFQGLIPPGDAPPPPPPGDAPPPPQDDAPPPPGSLGPASP